MKCALPGQGGRNYMLWGELRFGPMHEPVLYFDPVGTAEYDVTGTADWF